MNLPKKDKHGNSRLSYSQILCFKKSKKEYIDRYILKKPFISNPFIDFGSKVGNAIASADYKGFNDKETKSLNRVTKLDSFEKRVILKYEDFYLVGFVDSISNNLLEIIDYKTGGAGKQIKYMNDDYNQLAIYALSIRQEFGITPKKATVQFITREGNPYRRIPLTVSNNEIINIPVDISEKILVSVYKEVYKTAKLIEEFYDVYLNMNINRN
jgi:hypothetical protein